MRISNYLILFSKLMKSETDCGELRSGRPYRDKTYREDGPGLRMVRMDLRYNWEIWTVLFYWMTTLCMMETDIAIQSNSTR